MFIKKTRKNASRTLSLFIVFILVIQIFLTSVFPSAAYAQAPVGEVTAVFGSTPQFNGITANPGDNQDGIQVVTAGGKEGWRTNKAANTLFVYCDVDDAFIYDGQNNVAITVEYYDEGNAEFSLQYDSSNDTEKRSDVVVLGDTKQWKTHTFVLGDAKFANRFFTKDFRLGIWAPGIGKVEDVTFGSVSVKKVVPEPRQEVTAVFGSTPQFNGITANPGDNQDGIQIVTAGGKEGWRTNKAANTLFVYGDVDDGFIYDGENTVAVTVEYYDEGNAEFSFQYDSTNNTEKRSDIVVLGDTKQWKTHTFVLGDAKFANRFFTKDFRLGIWAPGIGKVEDVTFGSVNIKKLPSINPIMVKTSSSNTGNIFIKDQDARVNIDITNKFNEIKNITAAYNIVNDVDGSVVRTEMLSMQLQSQEQKSYQIDCNNINKYGVYTINLKVSTDDGQINVEKGINFSIIPQSVESTGGYNSDFFGACTHFAHAKGDPEKNLSLAKMAGIKWTRDEMYWSLAETEKGNVQILPSWDEYVNKAVEKGVKPLVILDYGNRFYDGGGAPYTDEGIAAFVNYAKTIATHFKGRVNHFEIWNEYNIDIFNPTKRPPEDYAKLLKAVYPVIKEIIPDAVIVGGVTAGTDLGWLERVLKAGGSSYMDAVSIHPYSYPLNPQDGGLLPNIQNTYNLIKKYGREIPVWITELGWPTQNDAYGVTETVSANYLVRSHVISIASGMVDKLFWYDLQNDGIDVKNNEENFGLIRCWSGEEVPWAAKAGYVAYVQMTNAIAMAEFKGEYTLKNNIKVYKFHSSSDNKDVLVMWTINGENDIAALKTDSDKVEVCDIFGNSKGIDLLNGKVNVSVSNTPVYVKGSFLEVQEAVPDFQAPVSAMNVTKGERVAVKINRSEDAAVLEGSYTVKLPERWTLFGDASFTAGKTVDEIVLEVPSNALEGSYQIGIAPVVGENLFDELIIQVNVVKPLALKVIPKPDFAGEWDKWSIDIELENVTTTVPLNGTISITNPRELTQTIGFTDLKPCEKRHIKVPVPDGLVDSVIDLEFAVNVENQEAISVAKKMSFLASLKAAKAPAIDGKIDQGEWSDSMCFNLNKAEQVKEIADWAGIDDLSGCGYVKWDRQNLYVAIGVKDNIHFQEDVGMGIWKGDSIQFTIDTQRINRPCGEGHHQFGFASNGSEITKWRWVAADGKTPGELKNSNCVITREGTNTSYEIAIPWSEILSERNNAAVDTLLGFSLLINDNDGSGRRGWIEYMGGIGYGQDVAAFGDLVLVDQLPVPEIAVTGIKLNTGSIGLKVNETATLTAVIEPGNAANKLLIWKSDNEAVATIKDGVITAKGAGTATITVEAVSNSDVKATCIVEVKNNSSSSNADNSHKPVPGPEKPGIVVSNDGTVNIILKPILNNESKTAKAAIQPDVLKEALDQAKQDANASKKIVLEIQKVEGANQYIQELPADELTLDNTDKTIEIKTPFANITVPGNMFKADDIKNTANVGICIGNADLSKLEKSIVENIGSRPVVELTATADGKPVAWNNPDAPVKVTIDYTPSAEELKDPEHIVVWYIDGAGKAIPVYTARYDAKTGKVTFTTTHFSKYAVAYVKKTFSDAGKYKWAQKQIEVLASKGIVDTGKTAYMPEANITRGEFMAMLVRALGLTAMTDGNFDDVKAGDKYYEELAVAKKLGIANGGGNNKFSPNKAISRQDMMVLVDKALEVSGKLTVKGKASDLNKFSDVSKIASYAKQSMANLYKAGIVQGGGKGINPLGYTTKASAAVLIYNLLDK